jgi:hypothetical protein
MMLTGWARHSATSGAAIRYIVYRAHPLLWNYAHCDPKASENRMGSALEIVQTLFIRDFMAAVTDPSYIIYNFRYMLAISKFGSPQKLFTLPMRWTNSRADPSSSLLT